MGHYIWCCGYEYSQPVSEELGYRTVGCAIVFSHPQLGSWSGSVPRLLLFLPSGCGLVLQLHVVSSTLLLTCGKLQWGVGTLKLRTPPVVGTTGTALVWIL